MKTMFDRLADLVRAVKMRAGEENRRLEETLAELRTRGPGQTAGGTPTIRNRVRLPLVLCAHEAPAGEEMTPERVAQVLLEAEEPR